MPSVGLVLLLTTALSAQVDWLDVTPAPVMPAPLMAFDAANGGILAVAPAVDGDVVWLRRLGAWEKRTPATRLSRYAFAIASEFARRRILLTSQDPLSQTFETWEWDGTDRARQNPLHSPPARSQGTMSFDDARGQAVLFGGWGTAGALGDTWLWNGSDWTQANPTNIPPPRAGAAMVFDSARGVVLMHGGHDSSHAAMNDCWSWNGTDWSQLAAGPGARWAHAMCFDSLRSKVVLYGGTTPSGISNPDTWEWDGLNWSSIPSSGPGIRANHGMVFDPIHFLSVLMGGGDGSGSGRSSSGTWEWDGANWVGHDLGAPSLPASTPSMGYDPDRGVAVLFPGGEISRFALGDVHEWNGHEWREASAQLRPPSRRGHVLAFDPVRRRMLPYGGDQGIGFVLGDTWEWDGSRWFNLLPTSPLGPRTNYGMATDTRRGRIVLFGGSDGGVPKDDTWERDGSFWRRVATGGLAGRSALGLAYDEARGVTVMFGGRLIQSGVGWVDLDETWEWRGSSWVQVHPRHHPPARYLHVMQYDALRERVVIEGGRTSSPSTYLTDTWEWDGTDWIQRTTSAAPAYSGTGRAACFDRLRSRVVVFDPPHLWEYGTRAIPSIAHFGSGCVGTDGVPTLEGSAGGWPWLGENFVLTMIHVPNGSTAVFAFGLSDAMWGSRTLPLDLGPLGMVGCSMLASPDAMFGPAFGGPVAATVVPIPLLPSAASRRLYAQGFVFDARANAAGMTSSDGLALGLGVR